MEGKNLFEATDSNFEKEVLQSKIRQPSKR